MNIEKQVTGMSHNVTGSVIWLEVEQICNHRPGMRFDHVTLFIKLEFCLQKFLHQ